MYDSHYTTFAIMVTREDYYSHLITMAPPCYSHILRHNSRISISDQGEKKKTSKERLNVKDANDRTTNRICPINPTLFRNSIIEQNEIHIIHMLIAK